MPETLRDFIAHASKSIDRIFFVNGIVRPMWHAVTRGGEELIFPPPSPDKDTAVIMVRVLFELRDVVRYVFIDEAWIVAAFGKDATPEKLAAVRQAAITGAASSPHREEVVMLAADDAVEGSLMARRKIIRPAVGRAKLGPLEYDPRGGQIAGRFVGLVPRKSATLQ
jgi:hypothetical protein